MPDRNTGIHGKQIKDKTLTKVELDADGEVAGYVARVQSDGTVDWEANVANIQVVFDGGGSVIEVNEALNIEIPFNCEITQVSLLSEEAGSIQIDIYKDNYTNYPPVVGDTITASAIPAIASSIKYQDNVLTGWTKTITAGDILRFNVDSVTTITRCTLSLKVIKLNN